MRGCSVYEIRGGTANLRRLKLPQGLIKAVGASVREAGEAVKDPEVISAA